MSLIENCLIDVKKECDFSQGETKWCVFLNPTTISNFSVIQFFYYIFQNLAILYLFNKLRKRNMTYAPVVISYLHKRMQIIYSVLFHTVYNTGILK